MMVGLLALFAMTMPAEATELPPGDAEAGKV